MTATKNNNPCGMCRALGLPTCKGHAAGAGGGGGGGGGGSDGKSDPQMQNTPASARPVPEDYAHSNLLDGKFWKEVKWLDNAVKYEKPEALCSITIENPDTLTIEGKKGLSKEDQKVLLKLFDAIKHELAEFKTELQKSGISVDNFKAKTKDNTLTITIPNQAYFNQFLQRLDNKNLLPNKVMLGLENKNTADADKTHVHDNKSAFKTPFSMKNHPKGWIK